MRGVRVLAALMMLLGARAVPGAPLNVLAIVTGEGHDVNTVVTTLSWLLKRHDGVHVSLHRDTSALTAQSLQSTKVVILYAPGSALTSEGRQALQEFVDHGGGLVLVHTSLDGAPVETAAGNVVVEVSQVRHPVIRSIPAFQVVDAPIQAGENIPGTIALARQRGGAPLLWVGQQGKGRTAHIALGHTAAVWSHPHFQQLLLNAVYWCAGRAYPSRLPSPPKGFTALFNGVNLEGWGEVGPPVWYARDGVIVCTGLSDSTGWLRSNRMYRDFVLRLEYRISPGGNSGIFLRAPHYGRSSRLGMELQIQDDGTSPPSTTCTSAVYSVVTPRVNPARPAGEWNEVEITLRGRHLRVVWNGQLVHDIHLDDPALSANLPRTHLLYRRPNWGYIGLQNHRSLVEFRNIFVRELQ